MTRIAIDRNSSNLLQVLAETASVRRQASSALPSWCPSFD
jgi:hypothetical protein